MYKPLEGIKVVDFSLAGAGPSCTKLLVEYGAQDIWVEPLQGSSTRGVHKFDFYCTGKRAITLNLKAPEGLEAMYRLIESADIFVTNYRPKAVQKLGLGYEELHRRNPGLIYASLTGFGEEGDEANNPGYDPVAFWAKGGMLRDFAEEGSILVPPIAVGDITAGMSLAGGICAALLGRAHTGEGCHVFTSLLAQAAYLNHDAIVETQYGEIYPKSRLAPRRALLNTYCCSDGKWITITITADFERYFWKLLRVVGREDLVGDPRWKSLEDTMFDNAPELVAILDKAFGAMTQDEAVAALNSIDAPVSRVQSTVEMMQDPQVLANKYVYKLDVTARPDENTEQIWVPAGPVKFGDVDYNVVGNTRGPRLGEHTAEILREHGYSDTEIQALIQAGVTTQSQ